MYDPVSSNTSRNADHPPPALFSTIPSYFLSFLIALVIFATLQVVAAKGLFPEIKLPDADDAMRLVRVRDLLAGQSWFDNVQHRMMPPEGVSLHWSRYVDLPIMALIALFSTIFDRLLAEQLTLIVWPSVLFVCYLILVGETTRRAFGNAAACFAFFGAVTTPIYLVNNFGAGRIDHHNIQILCMAAITTTLVISERGWKAGFIGGLLSAFSLAVGFETAPFLVLAAGIIAFRYIVSGSGETRVLAFFGISLGVFSLIFFVGQTAPELWGLPTCDTLSPPWLILTSMVTTVSGLILVADDYLATFKKRLIFILLQTVIFAAVAVAVLQNCGGGPYAALPPDVKTYVLGWIIEAMPFQRVIQFIPVLAWAILGPLMIGLVFSILVFGAISAREPAWRRQSMLIAILIIALGLALSMIQIRIAIIALAVFPIVFGVVVANILRHPLYGTRSGSVIAAMLAMICMSQLVWMGALYRLNGSGGVGTKVADTSCRDPRYFEDIQVGSDSRILTSMNMSANFLQYTPYSVLSGPYHRSIEAMSNGVLPFVGDERTLYQAVAKTGADYVAVCRGQIYGTTDSIGSKLARDERIAWLEVSGEPQQPLVLLRVDAKAMRLYPPY